MLVRIVDLGPEHLEHARRLAAQAYAEECEAVPALPAARELPDLAAYADNGLGVAAVEDAVLVGFLGCERPWGGAFGQVRGTFAPIHAHGADVRDRAAIYDRLYQAASGKWVAAGILSHAIGLYAHDRAAQRSFFDNGFGGRTVDAIRDLSPIAAPVPSGISIREAGVADAEAISALATGLTTHLRQPPMFMPLTAGFSAEVAARQIGEGRYRFVAAFEGGRAVAYLRWQDDGETFASEDPATQSITGAYALPEVRGTGVADALLAWLIDRLRDQGHERCGVDYESFNYTARGFWPKHFMPYTVGVVRRIDERIVQG